MKREVWSLIAQDDTKTGGNSYARWIKHSGMKVRPWQWTPFTNSARGPNDTFVLYHWQHKPNPDDPPQEYAFAKFNKVKSRICSTQMSNSFVFLSMSIFRHIPILNTNNIYKIKIGHEQKPTLYSIYVEDLN